MPQKFLQLITFVLKPFLRIFLASGYSCTALPCLDRIHKRSVTTQNECKPGERWKVDCNDCFCTETGIGACTLRGCLGPHYSSHHRVPVVPSTAIRSFTVEEFNADDFECTPHEYFKLECNSCKCGSGGRTARCTKKACINVP